MFCCKEPPHCDTLHTDFELCCRLEGRKEKKDLTAVNWALMCLTHSVKNKSRRSDKLKKNQKKKTALFSTPLFTLVIYSTFAFGVLLQNNPGFVFLKEYLYRMKHLLFSRIS